MAFFDKMKESISLAGQEVSQRTKNATETVRIGNLIKNNERMIEKLTYQVGLQCVQNHLNESGTEYEELFREILRLNQEIAAYQEELRLVTASAVCPQCGHRNQPSAKFCIGCGAPLTAAPTNGKVCPNCSNVNTEDAVFCVECGTPLPTPAPAPAPEPPIPEQPSIHICPGCGAELEPDALFCIQCGMKQE